MTKIEKKKKNKRWIWISFMSLIIVAMIISFLPEQVTSLFQEGNGIKTSLLTEEEQEGLLKEVSQMNSDGYRPAEIYTFIESHQHQITDEYLTKMVRELVINMEVTGDYYADFLYIMQPELGYAANVDEVSNVFEEESLTNHFAEGFVKELERNFMLVNHSEESVYLEPDMSFVEEKYGERVTGVFKDYLNISASQQNEPIFDSENNEYVPERLRDLIVIIDNSRNRWMDTEYANDFQNLEEFYYQALFGYSQGTFFDEVVKNEGKENEEVQYFMKERVLDAYNEIILENKDLTLSKELKEFIQTLKAENNEINQVVTEYLESFLSEKFDRPLAEKE